MTLPAADLSCASGFLGSKPHSSIISLQNEPRRIGNANKIPRPLGRGGSYHLAGWFCRQRECCPQATICQGKRYSKTTCGSTSPKTGLRPRIVFGIKRMKIETSQMVPITRLQKKLTKTVRERYEIKNMIENRMKNYNVKKNILWKNVKASVS